MRKVWGTVNIPCTAPHSPSLAQGEAGEDLVWIRVVLRGPGVGGGVGWGSDEGPVAGRAERDVVGRKRKRRVNPRCVESASSFLAPHGQGWRWAPGAERPADRW